ncbi:hypothetical protein E3V55_03610 [Candidatus Marinimicrobia bacterium MT.SAG.3]|nr:hypothetical protein E3V55_03610 [Candidatus Marinimicrobia bacterium MT.SAG.3]
MGAIALIIAIIAFAILWSSDHELFKWMVLGAGIVAAYLRAVVSSIARRSGQIGPDVKTFWMHAANISFWISIILSIVVIVSAFK